jgi:hypothetical protein
MKARIKLVAVNGNIEHYIPQIKGAYDETVEGKKGLWFKLTHKYLWRDISGNYYTEGEALNRINNWKSRIITISYIDCPLN